MARMRLSLSSLLKVLVLVGRNSYREAAQHTLPQVRQLTRPMKTVTMPLAMTLMTVTMALTIAI